MAANTVPELLDGLNYANWSVCMKNYLLANDLWDIVEATTEAPSPEEPEGEYKAWIKKNAAALHAIQISCMSHILSQIKEIGSARICWDSLAKMHEVQSPGDQIQPQEVELPPVKEELQQQAAVNQGTEGHVYVQFRPLHKAIESGDLNSVRDFLHFHPNAVNKKLTDSGRTALHLATLTGKLKMVEELVELLSEEDLQVLDNNHETALMLAAVCWSHKNCRMHDKKEHARSITKTRFKFTSIFWLLTCNFILLLFNEGLKQIYDTKLTHAYALEILHWISEDISTIDDTKLGQSGVFDAFFRAIQYGIIEVVIEMLKANPNLLTVLNTNRRGILQSAVQHRQEKIFSLIYVLDTRKYMLISGIDEWKNNILHIAATLAPPDRLAHISGAVLQMQRELQWYKEVESIVNPLSKEYTNIFNERPSQIFSNTHKQLVSDGEKWMKETATSCTVVGALIITIMFTAAFTVPGVLMFLGVLTSRYAEDDFIKSLPTKLIIGLSTLFISIAAMMVAFCATLIIMLKGEMKLVIPITLLASIPVTLFILLQFPLLVEIFVSIWTRHL
ncbi:hypothetical protein GH714_006113 [Hevea brasiliensis]|uniref:PGG domain-containing protein n=1 Tax=Hevea brasiliensis TaxID=3981 RepID=A0A6A6MZ14_HEVBR|nr:hypothetical protein GH714_006113 [Hevea brasiliensis]